MNMNIVCPDVRQRLAVHLSSMDWKPIRQLYEDPVGACVLAELELPQKLFESQIRLNKPQASRKISFWTRMVNVLMTTKRNGGKRRVAERVLVDTLDLVLSKTSVPAYNIFLRAFHRALISEDVRSMKFGSTKLNKLVCVTPIRMISVALKNLLKRYTKGRSVRPACEVLAAEWIACSEGDGRSVSVTKKKQSIQAAASANL